MQTKELLNLFERELFDVEYVHGKENVLRFFAHHRFSSVDGIYFEIGPDVKEARITRTPSGSTDIEAEIHSIKAAVAAMA